MIYKISSLCRTFNLSKPTLRKYIRQLKTICPSLSGHLSHGKNNTKLIDSKGLALLDTYIHTSSSTNAMRLAHKVSEKSQQTVFSKQLNKNTNQIISAIHKSDISHRRYESLKNEKTIDDIEIRYMAGIIHELVKNIKDKDYNKGDKLSWLKRKITKLMQRTSILYRQHIRRN